MTLWSHELPLCGGQGWRLHSADFSSMFTQSSFSSSRGFSSTFSKSFHRELMEKQIQVMDAMVLNVLPHRGKHPNYSVS